MTDNPRDETRDAYAWFIEVPTRWSDNDMLGHLNNVVFNRAVEQVVVQFTIGPLGIDWRKDTVYPVVVESLCRFHEELSFPETLSVGLRVGRLGQSSVTYDVAIFGEGRDSVAATGHFIQVFIDHTSRKSSPIPPNIRHLLEGYTTST